MPKQVHVAMALDAALEMTDSELIDAFVKPDGTLSTPKAIRRRIMLAYSKGYEVLPPCDNVKENGTCAGHGQREST